MMFRTLAIAAGLSVLLAGPAMANDCERDLSQINAALAKPKELKYAQADMGADTLLKAVNVFVEQAEADQKAGNEKTCVTRLVAAKKILKID